MLNHYEERQENRRARLEAQAESKRAESESQFKASNAITDNIPLGQPILIGHHSEKGHRGALKRSDNAMHRSIEAAQKAKHYEHQAAAVGKGGISSDDPEAIRKLEAKLAHLEDNQNRMKKTNAEFRKSGIDGISDEKLRDTIRSTLERFPYYKQPFPRYALTNNNSNIRTTKKRIESLRVEMNREPVSDVEGEGFTLSEDQADNRILFHFDAKPEEGIRDILKRHGFRFSPRRNNAWVRQSNNGSRYAAKMVIAAIEERKAK